MIHAKLSSVMAALMTLAGVVGCGTMSPQTNTSGPANHSIGEVKTNSPAAQSGLVPAVVTQETDGDTIHVRLSDGKEPTIRMLLIDTPEDKKPGTPVEPFSLDAARYCAQVMPVGKHVYLQEGVAGHQYDKYGRLLAFVYLTPTDMYNEDVVKKGLARVAYIYPPNTQHLSVLEADESYAKTHHLGIWTIPGYVTNHGYNMAAVHTSGASKSTHASTSSTSTSNRSVSGTSISSQPTITASSGGIRVVADTLGVRAGWHASVEVQVKPRAVGHIEVDYKSGPSHAKGLGPKTANSQGDITWTWDVGSNTTPGDWPVVITVGKATLRLTLHVK